ncbi:MAG: undecaprenyldiphospho-muramoylpentapeptide beta-N-acetylglucosaminyltransferase [Candidatus Tantalella remota]|nr:undecaprenyldiphospho-muramoylpentapeptide beta-N-acetylglucosaminyltransferase [Candidatus Tantalella remota]
MNGHNKRIILAAGGSGGHIFPAIALASELEKKNAGEICFISSKRRLDRDILKETGYRCFFLSINPMPLKFAPVRVITFFLKLAMDTVASFCIIVSLRPDAVVGFGGYSSGAIARAAKIFGIPLLIHEQNLVPGRANRILCRAADKIAVSFKGSEEQFSCDKEKVIFSGNPLRTGSLSRDREASARALGVSPEKFTILVMGGSQGASFLNRTVSEAARRIARDKDLRVQFIHLTGKKDLQSVSAFYSENGIPGRVFSFLEKIEDAYAASDMAISRAGAAAVFELAYYAKPMILVPYPNPKNNQRSNAEYFADKGAAICREEKDLTPESLYDDILNMMEREDERERLSKAAGALSVPDAAEVLAGEVMKLVENRDKG